MSADLRQTLNGILYDADAICCEDIIGPGEIRTMAGGVTRATLMKWRTRDDFPKPIRELGIGPLWDRRAVQTWLTGYGR